MVNEFGDNGTLTKLSYTQRNILLLEYLSS